MLCVLERVVVDKMIIWVLKRVGSLEAIRECPREKRGRERCSITIIIKNVDKRKRQVGLYIERVMG